MRGIVAVSLVLMICLVATKAFAGRLFGDVRWDGKPVPAGLPLWIAVVPPSGSDSAAAKPVPAAADSTVTDEFGSYKLAVKQQGKCILTLVYEKQELALEVFSYETATRYDLVVERKDGKLSLRRK
jgi:hypothetical protein